MFFPGVSFTVFDTETTGLNPEGGDRIVEIAGVKIINGIIDRAQNFHSLVNPERGISWEARSVNRICEEELLQAPTIDSVLPRFLEFAADSILVAHNAEFDVSFLHAGKDLCWGYIDIPECLCTLTLSRTLFPQGHRHNLTAVATRLGLPLPSVDRHRALTDVLLTAEVFLALLRHGRITSLDDLQKKSLIASWQ